MSVNRKPSVTLDIGTHPLVSPGLIDAVALFDLFLSSKTHGLSWAVMSVKH
jgi:hypothetical protein